MELKQTIDLMCSADYKERFLAEYHQTKIRYEKLKTFCNKIEVALIMGEDEPKHDSPYTILKDQLINMARYLSVLEKRAIIEGIDLSDDLPCQNTMAKDC